MTTDSERREVAHKLRRIAEKHDGVAWPLVEKHLGLVGDDRFLGSSVYTSASVLHVVDLIEPEPERTRGKYGPRGVNDCPRCGAVPSHQKRKPRKTLVDIGRLWPIFDTNPVDGVVCLSCGTGFRVAQLEHDDTYFDDLEEEFEFVPRFCPNCGAKVVDDD